MDTTTPDLMAAYDFVDKTRLEDRKTKEEGEERLSEITYTSKSMISMYNKLALPWIWEKTVKLTSM